MPRILGKFRAFALVLFLIAMMAGVATAGLDKHLEALEPYLDKTFEGTFTDGATGAGSVDVQRWEATLGGKAIRVVHSLNEGEYGGETIIFWDSQAAAELGKTGQLLYSFNVSLEGKKQFKN